MTIFRDLSIMWSLFHILILFIFLYESRFDRRKTLFLTCIAMLPLIAVNVTGLILLGTEGMGKIFPFTCTLPSLLFFFIVAKYRDGRFFFTFCLADTISLEVIVLSNIVDFFLPGRHFIVMFFMRLFAFPALELITYRYLRKPYHKLQQSIRTGWGAFALISALFYVLLWLMSNFPVTVTARPEYIPAVLLVLALMPLMYLNIFQVLYRQQQIFYLESEQNLLRVQAAAITQRMAQTAESEEQLRIIRHDLRHQLRTISALIKEEQYDDALRLSMNSDSHLEESQIRHWCSHPILDAVFASYFQQAEKEGIRIHADITLPEILPAEAAELSTVFANALENAINACRNLEPEQRFINCKCIGSPTLMFKLENSFCGRVDFNEAGLPVCTEKGHGLGTRSIAAFCAKYSAAYNYHAENGVFSFYIAM